MNLVQFDPTILEMVTLASDDSQSAFEFLRELLQMFKTGTEASVVEIYNCLDDGEIKEAGELAHRMKSSCLALGFNGLALACGAIEKGALEGKSAGELEAILAAFEDALPFSVGQLERYIETQNPPREAW